MGCKRTGAMQIWQPAGMPLLHRDRDFGLIAGVEPKLMLVAAGNDGQGQLNLSARTAVQTLPTEFAR
jgi:hypothetical protein